MWFYFEKELGLPVTPVTLESGRQDLSGYNVLLIPNGSANRLWRDLGEYGANGSKAWVHSGGAVVAMGDAVGLLNRKELELTTVKAVTADSTRGERHHARGRRQARTPAGVVHRHRGPAPEFVPGAIFRATLDQTHWLTGGYEQDQLPVFFDTSSC